MILCDVAISFTNLRHRQENSCLESQHNVKDIYTKLKYTDN